MLLWCIQLMTLLYSTGLNLPYIRSFARVSERNAGGSVDEVFFLVLFFLFFRSAALVCTSSVERVSRVLQSVGSILVPITDGLISSLRSSRGEWRRRPIRAKVDRCVTSDLGAASTLVFWITQHRLGFSYFPFFFLPLKKKKRRRSKPWNYFRSLIRGTLIDARCVFLHFAFALCWDAHLMGPSSIKSSFSFRWIILADNCSLQPSWNRGSLKFLEEPTAAHHEPIKS